MKEFWDKRYATQEYAYGKLPNRFFQENLDQLKKQGQVQGKIILPAEGEGRNAVYAAQQGMSVFAFDTSIEGKKKADQLALDHSVSIDYQVGSLEDLDYPKSSFQVGALIYAHFPPTKRSAIHREIGKLIQPEGILILEGFSKRNIAFRKLNPSIGGPQQPDFLFSEEEIRNDFSAFDILLLEEAEVDLEEGNFHRGRGSVIRFVGVKR